ncbi:MAG: lipopolysaccharide kinase InaA family protein [Roseinatronobacter sp.]
MTNPEHDYSAEALLAVARTLPNRRLSRVTVGDRVYYVKMAEAHRGMRWRLQKGNPQASFERETALLQAFAARGASVPFILAQDAQRIVLGDHGAPVHQILANTMDCHTVLQATGKALANLHALGLAHGRPSLRDLCWDGTKITFLDLEAGASLSATPKQKARDLFLLLHSAMTWCPTSSEPASKIVQAYHEHGETAVRHHLSRLARRFYWLDILASPVIWRDVRRGKKRSEFLAFRRTRQLILKQEHAGG